MSGYVAFEWYRTRCVSLQHSQTVHCRLQTECFFRKEKYKDGIFGLEVTVEGHSAISGATSIAYTLKDAEGKAVLQDAIRIKSRGLSNLITFDRKNLPDVKAWSAEHPHLYTLILELKDEQGKVTELTGCEVGFRTSEIKDGRFCINGVPVLVKGTNRHEHSQLGRTVSKKD